MADQTEISVAMNKAKTAPDGEPSLPEPIGKIFEDGYWTLNPAHRGSSINSYKPFFGGVDVYTADQVRAMLAASPAAPTAPEGWRPLANHVCGSIPVGWEIELCMENGAAWVTLRNPEGDHPALPDAADKSIEQQIQDALNVACEEAAADQKEPE